MNGIGPNELQVALTLMRRAPIEGADAKAVAVTIDKFERALQTMAPPMPVEPTIEVSDGDDSEPAE